MNDHRPSLRAGDLDAFWERVRDRVERTDGPIVGRLTVPELTSSARLTLSSLLGRPLGKTIELAGLQAALARLELGPTLAEALGELGWAPSPDRADRRADRRTAARARHAAREEAASWPELWRDEWIESIIRVGAVRDLDETGASAFVREVRRTLDRLEESAAETSARARSRVDLAAELFGDSHALDAGTRLEAAIRRALIYRHEAAGSREAWQLAGVHLDLTSAPVLTWNLRLAEHCPLRTLVEPATSLGLPIHLSQFALREHPAMPGPDADVLVVENPRLVEAATQRRSGATVIATNGNPSTAVRLLLGQLIGGGARVRCHADFDSAGLAICGRLAAMGLEPWHMATADYVDAVAVAEEQGVELPLDPVPPPPTPWDRTLRDAFGADRRIVHEERMIEQLLG